MPSLKDIRRRIDSVKKTQQITRAMRMVAGAKLRRAQQASEAARPYAERMRATLAEVASAQREAEHPLLVAREALRAVEVVVVSSDRGLCGAFNANVCKHADRLIQERLRAGQAVTLTTAGRKFREFAKRRYAEKLGDDYPQAGWVQYGQAAEIGRRAAARFAAGEVDEVVLVYNQFVTTMTQRPLDRRLIPVAGAAAAAEGAAPGLKIEPSAEAVLRTLVPMAIEVEIYQGLLENQAGEHAARMTAMEAATRNTEELIGSLTLQFNRARQAAITKELVEIVSGAEAL